MKHMQDYTYSLTLNLYFDNVNGDPAAIDQVITANVFDKRTDRLLRSYNMTIKQQSFVPYTNIDCTVGELDTRKIVYTTDVYLDPTIFFSSEGYYVSWERCCRNRTINNIVRPEDAAQTFYMEFPAVVQNGEFFKNSSPILFPPLSDYACVNELFYFDFNGTDPDGDSLVYDMVTPLNGYTTPTRPSNNASTPRPSPYPTITWAAGYGQNNQVQGSPAINIDSETGQLTMRPSRKGLFVFGVRAQEYRNGEKIGEVRRDFQVLVLDCPQNQAPKVVARGQNSKANYQEGQVLRINSSDADRCINVLFTDPDMSEYVELRARPVNFSRSDYSFVGTTKGMINQAGQSDTLQATLCFDKCFDTEGKVYLMDLIVKDDGCSLPRQDTVRVSFIIEPTPDVPPTISLSTGARVFEVHEGQLLDFNVLGIDPDEDEVTVSLQAQGFDPVAAGINFSSRTGTGTVSSPFSWPISCETLKQESYTLNFIVSSTVCGKEVTRTETIEVRTVSDNNLPTLTSDQPDQVLELELGVPFTANLLGQDVDLDELIMRAAGEGFNMANYGMQFTSSGGTGEATGQFTWTPVCEAVGQEPLRVKFSLSEDACDSSPDQELVLEFRVKAPNNAPTFTTDQSVYSFTLNLNEEFKANFEGLDIDLNQLQMQAQGEGFSLEDYGMQFTSIPGAGEAQGTFTWLATCPATEEQVLRVNFFLLEAACDPKPQQLTMEFKVQAPKIADYIPANIFTPNGDDKNEYFEIPNLPSEFCSATFRSIRIFNRWGREVYRSTSSQFKWDGKDVNDGVYFYVIDYGTSTYRGSVTLVR